MSEELRAISKSTAQEICDAVKEKEGSTEGVPFNVVADRIRALSVGGGENKFAQLVERSITELTVKDFEGVTQIGESAFRDCPGLTNVTFSNTITSINKYAFYRCDNLSSVTIPRSVMSIGEYTFANCSALKDAYYEGDIAGWCNISFYDGAGSPVKDKLYIKNINGEYELLTSVVVPNNVTEIKKYTFYACKSITSVVIPNSVTSIGSGAFNSCRNLASITILNGVTSISDSVFTGCTKLENITIPDSVTTLGIKAFASCSGLTNIRIGNGITSIGTSAFQYCSALTDIYIDAPEDSISGAPWGAPNSPTIHWNTPLPSEEV